MTPIEQKGGKMRGQRSPKARSEQDYLVSELQNEQNDIVSACGVVPRIQEMSTQTL